MVFGKLPDLGMAGGGEESRIRDRMISSCLDILLAFIESSHVQAALSYMGLAAFLFFGSCSYAPKKA